MLHLTPEMVEAAYELLRATRPFRRWRLPPADEVEFHIRHFAHHADCAKHVSGRFTIRVSSRLHGRLDHLVETVAHEMVHIQQDHVAPREGSHGRAFHRLAAQVCRHHGFDPQRF